LDRAGPAGADHFSDVRFTDKAGRPIAIRTWESGNQAYIRAYDTGKTQVPDHPTMVYDGQAGFANARLERSADGQARVRLQDVMTSPEYRHAGTADRMLHQAEQFGQKNGAAEIYGSIENDQARAFWEAQADEGWAIRPGGYYGEVYRVLR
jgi:GNAT superfamily N-acetyltransferase